MSRKLTTLAAALVVLLTMVAVLGVGAGRDTATATATAQSMTPVPGPQPAASVANRSTPVQAATGSQGGTAGSSKAPQADYDGDGIPNSRDACPTRPETYNGFQDADGCPDVVATTGAS